MVDASFLCDDTVVFGRVIQKKILCYKTEEVVIHGVYNSYWRDRICILYFGEETIWNIVLLKMTKDM